jgi:hypothetical protein
MGSMIAVQIIQDVGTLRSQTLGERLAQHSLTSLELAVVWAIFGASLYAFSRWMSTKSVPSA